MHIYEDDDILKLCDDARHLMLELARKTGMRPQLVKETENRLPVLGNLASQVIKDVPLYTVTQASILPDGKLKHSVLLDTPHGWEALEKRNKLNESKPFYGATEIAQVIRREVKPRLWKLWMQLSTSEVHLKCSWTQARALLRKPTPQLLDRLHRGYTLPQNRSVYLQSELVSLTTEFTSCRSVSFKKADGITVTQQAELLSPVVYDLDISEVSELLVDGRQGVVAKHPFQDDKLIIPEKFAKALWGDGIIIPIEAHAGGKALVRLVDPELRSRLELSRLKIQNSAAMAAEGSRSVKLPPPLSYSTSPVPSHIVDLKTSHTQP